MSMQGMSVMKAYSTSSQRSPGHNHGRKNILNSYFKPPGQEDRIQKHMERIQKGLKEIDNDEIPAVCLVYAWDTPRPDDR